jgi:hypothetical protein
MSTERSELRGRHAVATKVHDEADQFVEAEAERMGVYRSGVLREALALYINCRHAEMCCPECGEDLEYKP